MSIDHAKGIQLLLWRIIRFSGSCCYRFVRKYPVVSGFFIFVFFLYMFFPSVFYFLLYSSPILVCTAAAIRFYLKTKYPEFQWIKRNDSERTSADANRSNDPSLRHQKSVRRNARKEVVEWDRKQSEERNMLFPRSPYDSLSGNTNILEENSKLIFDVKGSSGMEHGESSSHNQTGNDRALDDPKLPVDNETSKPHSVWGDSLQGESGKGADHGGGEVEVESLEEGEDEEDEEVHGDGNKAMEWTEDDHKNLMDLGLSELERNKRLESLIAKRRARKLFRMALEKSLMDKDSTVLPNQIAPILIVKGTVLGAPNNPIEEGLQMPGSAPSILLPTQNPFDLPYDPLEEKPNLMADSFHQEFMAANQKEMLFCRHESLCRGSLFALETTQDPNDAQFNPSYGTQKRLVESAALPNFKRQSDKGDHHQHNSSGIASDIDLVELEDCNQNEAMNSSEGKQEIVRESAKNRIEMGNSHDLELRLESGSELRMETDSIKNNDSCDSSSSEATESVLDQTSKSPKIQSDQVRKYLNLSIPPKGKTMSRLPYDSSPSPSERRKADFNLFYSAHRRRCHTRTCSIASDLQVEISEVGSPPLTTDGTISSVDGDSVTYDGDVDRDINSDSEEMWGGSFNLSRGEANQEKLRELHDIIEEDSVEVEFPGLNRKLEEPIASPSPSEQEAKQNLDSTSSLSPIIDITQTGASRSTTINPDTHEDSKKIDEEVEGFKAFNVSDTLSTENPGKPMHLMEKLVVHSPSESCFKSPEQLVEPRQKPTEEFNIIPDEKPMTQENANTLDFKSSENRENGAQMSIEYAAEEEMRKPAEAINSDSSEYRDGNLETSCESKTKFEKEMEDNQPSKYIKEDSPSQEDTKYIKDDSPAQEDTQNSESEHNTGDAPNAVQSRDYLESIPDSIVDQNVTENNVSGVKQRFGGPIAMALNPRLLIGQISVGSVFSPRSVLPENILEDQIPISDIEQRIQADVPQSVMENITRDSLADDQPQENSTFDIPQNAQQLVENSMDHSSSNSSLGALEGSSNMADKTTNYSTVDNLNELVLRDAHGKEDSSTKSSEGESKPSSESNPGYTEHLEVGSEKLIDYDTGIDPSKSEEENAKSDNPETMVRKEEPTSSPRKVMEEGTIILNINNAVVNEKEEGEKLTTNGGESQFSVRPQAIMGPEKSFEHEADVNKAEANGRENTSIPQTAREGQESAAEVDLICDVNDSFADNVTNKEILNHVLDGEGEPQILSRQEAVMEPSNTSRATSAASVEDTEHEFKRLSEAEANAGLSTSVGESNILNNIKNNEEIQNLTGQEDALDAPQSGEDNLKAIENIPDIGNVTTGISTDHKVAEEASKPKELEVKAVNPEENDSNTVAK